MRKQYLTQKKTASSRHYHIRLIGLIGTLTLSTLTLLIFGIILTFALSSQANTNSRQSKNMSQQTSISTPTQNTKQSPGLAPANKLWPSNNQTGTQGSTNTSVNTAGATPTLIPSTPQATQLGVFPLTSGGPLPIPETILQPTNIARVMLNNTLISVYAGSMSQNPQIGILCVLREDLTTGQLNLHMYQTPHPEGPLTILAVQNTRLKVADPKSHGFFDLSTNQFQW